MIDNEQYRLDVQQHSDQQATIRPTVKKCTNPYSEMYKKINSGDLEQKTPYKGEDMAKLQ